MKEHPILFSAPMVRAILDGRKTQTRREVKARDLAWMDEHQGLREPCNALRCPYGQPGHRLWVRETWMPDAPRDGTWPDFEFYGSKGSPLSMIPPIYQKPEHCLFRATWSGGEFVGWKPSIHMPRWASRILLEITAVRVERLNDIGQGDACAEGRPAPYEPIGWFHNLWESTYGPGSWAANPWVWVVEFQLVKQARGAA